MDLPDADPRDPARRTERSAPVHSAPAARRTDAVPGGPLGARALLLVVPAVWLGLVIGISLIEAPLKFTAPGITIPLGLGIGRRVFLAMNVAEALLALLLLAALWRSLGRPSRDRLWLLAWASAALLVIKLVVIKPFLNRRTDAVLAGDFEGGSSVHYAYIAAEAVLIAVLVLLLVTAARAVLGVAAVGQPVHRHGQDHEAGEPQVHAGESGDRQQGAQQHGPQADAHVQHEEVGGGGHPDLERRHHGGGHGLQ